MVRITPKLKGTKISNFDLEVHRVVNVYTDSQVESVPQVEISLVFEGGSSTKVQKVDVAKLKSIDWCSWDHHVNFNIAAATAKRQIDTDIRSALDGLPVAEVYRLSHPGMYKINGEPVFCTGGEVIRPSSSTGNRPEIELEQMPQQLDIDPELSEEEAVAEVLNFIALFPDPGRIILSQVLVSLLRQAYEDAGKRPSFCAFLHGRTGTQKTTVSSFLTQVYNRSEGIKEPTRLNASQASAVEMLMGLSDQVQVFDDLFPSASNQVRKKQEETLAEITRYVGDGTVPARIKGSGVRTGHPRCGVLFTGEYLIGEGSDAARLLPVEMTKPDTSALSRFQTRPLIVSTFYRDFITWAINSYDAVVSYLKEWWEVYCNTDLNVHDRLRETHFFLNTAYALMLTYCGEKEVLSKEEIAQLHGDFLKLLSKLIGEQQGRVSPKAPAPPMRGNVLERIRQLYRSNQLSIPDDKRKFTESEHDGVMHRGCLCLREQVLSHFFPDRSIDDVAAELDEQGALSKGSDGFKKKISAARGNSFYWIPLNFL